MTGNFLCATCNLCNLQLKLRKTFKKKPRDDNFDDGVQGEWAAIPRGKFKADFSEIQDLVEKEIKEEYFCLFFHNLAKYNLHLILKHMEMEFLEGEVKVIAANTETFIAVDIGQI